MFIALQNSGHDYNFISIYVTFVLLSICFITLSAKRESHGFISLPLNTSLPNTVFLFTDIKGMLFRQVVTPKLHAKRTVFGTRINGFILVFHGKAEGLWFFHV